MPTQYTEHTEFANLWLKMPLDERENLTTEQYRYFIDPAFLHILKKLINASKQHKYNYMVTFTIDPTKNKIDDLLEETIEQYICNQSHRDALKITYFAYVKEYTKKGVAHWHAVITTTKPLAKNRFQFYEKLYGSVDISKTKVTTTQEALNYISKESSPIVIID